MASVVLCRLALRECYQLVTEDYLHRIRKISYGKHFNYIAYCVVHFHCVYTKKKNYTQLY